MQVSHVKFLRRLMVGLIVIVLAAVGFNYLETWRSRARIVKQAKEVLSPDMMRSADSIEYSHYENGAVRFKLRAQKLLETRDGKRFLQGIEGSDRNPDGSLGNQIESEKAEYDANRKLVDFSGDVRMDLGSNVQIRTDSLHYDLNTNIGSTDDKIRFISNRVDGTARGVRYVEAEKALELNHDVDFILTRATYGPDGTTRVERIKATSERGYYSKSAGILRFEGSARLESETSSLLAQSILASFRQDSNRLSMVICEGDAVYRSAAATEPRTLQGDRMVFSMNQESNGLQAIDVMGHGVFGSKSGSGEQELRAPFIHMTMDPLSGRPERVQSNGGMQFSMKRGNDETRLTGEILDALFTSGSSQLQSIRVQQNAHMLTRVGRGGREELSAGEIRLSFLDVRGRTSLDRLQADLNVRWNSLPGKSDETGGSLGRSLSAHSLTVQYSGDYLQSAKANGNVVISGLPAGSREQSAVRRLEADAVRFQFYPGDNHLQGFDGDGRVQVFYRTPPDPSKELPAREVHTSSSQIQGTFKDDDGSALSVSQWGGFKMQDGTRTAASSRCDYDAVRDVMVLSGSPRLSDSNGVTTGEVMSFDRNQGLLTVRRSVRTVVKPGGYGQATPFTDSAGSSTPSIVTADEMQYWTEPARVRFSGNVQLLSENGQLQAGTMQITGGGDELEAQGEVRHLIPRRAPKPEGGSASPAVKADPSKKTAASAPGTSILVTSARLRYLEKDRSIHYQGQVHLTAGSVFISADSLDAVLDEGRKQIERATATGAVEVRQDAREVKGERADYYLQPGKFVVSGNLAEISEPGRGKSLARRLTFYSSDDRILLENP